MSIISRFPIHPLKQYRGGTTVYGKPVEIGFYSKDEEGTIHFDERRIRYYYPPDLSTQPDLCIGFPDRYVYPMVREYETLDAVLKTIQTRNHKMPDLPQIEPNFVTWRGLVTKILVTPFARDSWEMVATRYNGTIFIQEAGQQKPFSNGGDKMSYWGYKFEKISTIPNHPSSYTQLELETLCRERNDEVVNTNAQFCSVFASKLGTHSFVMGAEVDSVDENGDYVELKTSRAFDKRDPKCQRAVDNFQRRKLLKFWAQSFLAAVPKVAVGFRDDEGKLRNIDMLKTLDLPKYVENKKMWDPTLALNFADAFFNWLKTVMVKEGKDVRYRIRIDDLKWDEIVCREETPDEHASWGRNVIPEWWGGNTPQ